MAEHLLALKSAAERRGIKIKRVIFDNELQKMLFKTSKGEHAEIDDFFKKEALDKT